MIPSKLFVKSAIVICLAGCLSSSVLSQGAQQILEVQQRLKDLGYDPGAPDGAVGPRTVAAIKKFQEDRSLSITGELDSETLAALGLPKPSSTAGQAPNAPSAAFPEIVPVRTEIEVDGTFVLFTDEQGRVQVEGASKVVKAGSYVPSGGQTTFNCTVSYGLDDDGQMRFGLPVGCDIDAGTSRGLWLPGTIHEIKGRIENLGIDGFVFEGDAERPLRFKLITGKGYVYQGGQGTVTSPDGTKHLYQ